jgi:hypothetical protein
MSKPEYKPTELKTFTVKRVGEARPSQKGDPFLECDTDAGLVAFWGGKVNQGNLDMIRAAKPPFRVTCEAFKPDSKKYAYWIPQMPRITELTELRELPSRTEPPRSKMVTASDLATWRRSVLRILGAIDGQVAANQGESVAARIGRMAHGGKIPREVAALMRTITEMRNTSEYEGKVLSMAESAAVSGAWAAVREWALTRGARDFE